MAVVSEFDARIEMKGFIDRSRAHYTDWYVGTAADPDARLSEHGVQESDWWIVRRLATAESAQRVAAHFHELGCDGAPGGAPGDGDDDATTAVYAYWKRGHTTP